MADLDADFQAAVADSKQLPQAPGNDVLLKLYALYKQSTEGDNSKKRPGFTDPVGRAKWDAWDGVKGTASEDAKTQYIELVNSLK